MKNLSIVFWVFLMGLFMACSAPSGIQDTADTAPVSGNHTIIVVQNPLSLADILVQVPGVLINRQLDRTVVTIRGGIPLYVLDGIRIGNDYQKVVELINVFDIESVEVIKGPSDTALYGPGSGHGVIIINTRSALEIEG